MNVEIKLLDMKYYYKDLSLKLAVFFSASDRVRDDKAIGNVLHYRKLSETLRSVKVDDEHMVSIHTVVPEPSNADEGKAR